MTNFPFPRTVSAALSVLAVLCVPTLSQAADTSLVSALKQGGHVIYIRHAMTETDYADQVEAVLGDCATQRVLSEAGWAQAKAIGAAIRSHDIPVSEVVSSEYCRAWQTADLAFGTYRQDAALNFAPSDPYTDTEVAQMKAAVTPLISSVPRDGNLIIVAHDDPFEAATGIYPEPQGVAYVILPTGDDFEVLGRIGPDDWQ